MKKIISIVFIVISVIFALCFTSNDTEVVSNEIKASTAPESSNEAIILPDGTTVTPGVQEDGSTITVETLEDGSTAVSEVSKDGELLHASIYQTDDYNQTQQGSYIYEIPGTDIAISY